MSDTALSPTAGGELADQPRRRKALEVLPPEFRKPAGYFYALYSDVLKSPLGLATRLQLWIAKEGLTLDDLREVFQRLATPEQAGRFEFAGQLHAALAAEVAATVSRRKHLERQLADRAARERRAAAMEPEARESLDDILASFGRVD